MGYGKEITTGYDDHVTLATLCKFFSCLSRCASTVNLFEHVIQLSHITGGKQVITTVLYLTLLATPSW